jgi:AcrR family transcriptional regulator
MGKKGDRWMAETSKGEKTRALVIQGAIRALGAIGVTGTTTRQIAAESGVHLASLHYHFDSKTALLLAVLDTIVEEDRAAVLEAVESITDSQDSIERVVRAAWRVLERDRPRQMVQYELTFYAVREGSKWLAKRQYDTYVRVYLELLLHLSKGAGGLKPEFCAPLARLIFAGLDGLGLQELADPNRSRSKRGIEALILAARQYAVALGGGAGIHGQGKSARPRAKRSPVAVE